MDQERIGERLEGLTASECGRAERLVEEIAHLDRMIAKAEGRKAAAIASLAAIAHAEGKRSANPDGIDYARRAMAAEVAAVTRTHPVAAKNSLEDAELLTIDLPETHAALQEGRISARHARVIAEAGRKIDPDARGVLDGQAVVLAEGRTPGDLGKIVRKRAAEITELSLRERHEREKKRRFVSVTDLDDAMSRLVLYLPTFEAHAIYERSTALAKVVKSDRTKTRARWGRKAGHPVEDHCGAPGCVCARVRGAGREAPGVDLDGAGLDGSGPDGEAAAVTDHRTLDQLRADILTDLFLGATPTGHDLYTIGDGHALENVTASVQVTIPASMIIDPGPDDTHNSEHARDSGPEHARASGADQARDSHADQARAPGTDNHARGAARAGPTGGPDGTSRAGSGDGDDPAGSVAPGDRDDRDDGARSTVHRSGSAWLDSGSLIAPGTARKVAGRAPGWERLFIRERTGVIEHVDHYRPSSAQRRSLIGRDLTCRFPGCTTPARKADIDHTHDYARGGKTTLSNLACLCEAHHVMKHQSGWGMRQLPGGVIEWTSPTGHTYAREPESRVYFRDTPAATSERSAQPDAMTGAEAPPAPGARATDTTTVETATGETATGDTATGDTATGDTATGEAATGEAATAETTPGEMTTGDTAPGDTAPGDTATGDTAPGDTATGDTATGATATGETATGATPPARPARSRSVDVWSADIWSGRDDGSDGVPPWAADDSTRRRRD